MSTKKQRGRGAKRALDYGEDQRTGPSQSTFVDLTSSETPQKRNKRDLNDFFGSPAPASTPSAKPSSSIAIVTPSEAAKMKEEEKKEQEYVPTYVHKNVEYQRKGKAQLSETTKKVFEFVEKNFIIPEGFENNRSFGPLSGVCFEERVIASYTNNLLKPKKDAKGIEICTCCASKGHKRDDCPTLI